MNDWFRKQCRRRPWWINWMLLFCLYMTFIYLPYDLFVKPMAVDEEVWFGLRFHGFWAKVLAVPHWVVYALGALGLWRMSPWARHFLSFYLVQVAIAFAVWPWLYLTDAEFASSLHAFLLSLPFGGTSYLYLADTQLALRLLSSVVPAALFLWLAHRLWGAWYPFRSYVSSP